MGPAAQDQFDVCARFLLNVPARLIAEVFHADEVNLSPQALKGTPHTDSPRLNISPTEEVCIVREHAAAANDPAATAPSTSPASAPTSIKQPRRELTLARWGLIPAWADDPKIASQTINARAETAATKPAFRDAFERRRCVIPASGFYEWRPAAAPRSRKQPVMIRRRDGRLLALAGLYESWKPRDNPDAPWLRTCTILTCEPSPLIAPIHNRMPALLAPGDIDAWLDPARRDTHALQAMLRPAPEGDLELADIDYSLNHRDERAPEEPTLFG
jgi:putative SOS response-associated peptidase YedK